MDLQPQASFIPRKPLTPGPQARGSQNLLRLAALFIFAVSVIAAIAVFLYSQYLNYQINADKTSLTNEQAAYDPTSIQDLVRLDTRIKQAEQLLKKHTAPSAIFTFLEQNTKTTVRFTQFSYDSNPDGTIALKLSGSAVDFASVALQSDQFGAATNVLKNVIFSGVNIDPATGIVGFQVVANFNPDQLLYRAAAPASGASSVTANTSASASTTPTQ